MATHVQATNFIPKCNSRSPMPNARSCFNSKNVLRIPTYAIGKVAPLFVPAAIPVRMVVFTANTKVALQLAMGDL